MAMRLRDELGIFRALAALLVGCRPGAGRFPVDCRSFVGRLSVLLCVWPHVSPAIHHPGAWPGPGHAPGYAPCLTETVGQTALSLVKSLSGSNITKIIGQPGSGRPAAVSGLRLGGGS